VRKFYSFIILLVILLPVSAQELHVMSFNIRYNNPGDSLNAWPHRKDKVTSQVLFHETHLLGVQEALYGQLQDMLMEMKAFKYVGTGRKDGKNAGEFSAIFYDTTRLDLLKTETFWLAEQTDIPGKKGWDAAFERIVTWALFRDKKNKKTFYHFNTHFDHMGKQARKESARLLLAKIKEIAGRSPVIVTGDFNAQPHDEPIQVITDKENKDRLIDAATVSAQPHYGPMGTFNAFGPKEIHDQPIDYIFIKNSLQVLKHATLSQSWEGRFSSDHFPVYAEIVLQ
jgi:endonuclease/exonuclease/phosphatase family metal-dependent hydrolase